MEVIVIGAGIGGLTTTLLLAADGHQVTLVERDDAQPPAPADAWDDWDRRGVNQFRLPHFFQPRYRQILQSEVPALLTSLEDAGMLRFDLIGVIPEQLTGGQRQGDEDFVAITGRRSVLESVVAAYTEDSEGVTVRRGFPVAGLLTGPGAAGRVPHVIGVKGDNGDELRADLVIDATGRRSPLPRWLEQIGAQPPIEELEDCGFTYYGRHFRSEDGSTPALIGPPNQDYGSLSALTLPADNGSWSIVLVASARDAAMRGLRDVDRWTEVVRTLPLVAHWLDGIPLEDKVVTMSKIEDRHRQFSTAAGDPLATGVVAVADSWACTNPSLGRGASIGAAHALALRDLLRTSDAEEPDTFARSWNLATDQVVEPWYRSTLSFDRHRLNEVHANIEGESYDLADDPSWVIVKALFASSGKDPDCLRALLSFAGVLRTPEETFASDPGLLEKVMELGAEDSDEPRLGPDREQLLQLVNG